MVTEATGLPPDEDCLHCYLPEIVEAWRRAHPHVSQEQLLIQMSQVLGELVGSFAPDVACADRMAVGVLSHVRRSARDTASALAKRRGERPRS